MMKIIFLFMYCIITVLKCGSENESDEFDLSSCGKFSSNLCEKACDCGDNGECALMFIKGESTSSVTYGSYEICYAAQKNFLTYCFEDGSLNDKGEELKKNLECSGCNKDKKAVEIPSQCR